MAKISARGDSEWKRWKRNDGTTIVLTKRGRLLRKVPPGGYTLVIRGTTDREGARRIVGGFGGYAEVS